jgi:hypothetical protein
MDVKSFLAPYTGPLDFTLCLPIAICPYISSIERQRDLTVYRNDHQLNTFCFSSYHSVLYVVAKGFNYRQFLYVVRSSYL